MLRAAISASGVYGGYFGAGQGILLIGILGSASRTGCSGSTRSRTCSRGLVNLTAGLVFVFAAEIDWAVAGLIAIGSLVGGALGRDLRAPAVADGAARR